MSEADALLAAICAHPDEDTPRLAFADWLDEHGAPARRGKRPPRFTPAERGAFEAEYVRVQCRLAQLPFDDPDYPELLERQDDLAVLLRVDDRGRVPKCPHGLAYETNGEDEPRRSAWGTYRRGFPDEVVYT